MAKYNVIINRIPLTGGENNKPVIIIKGTTKVKAQDIMHYLKSVAYTGENKFVAAIDMLLYNRYHIQPVDVDTKYIVHVDKIVKSDEVPNRVAEIECIRKYDSEDVDIYEGFKIECKSGFKYKRDDVLFRRYDMMDTVLSEQCLFKIVNNNTYLQLFELNNGNTLVLRQDPNVPRDFRLMTIPTQMLENAFISINARGGNVPADAVITNFINSKEKGNFGFYVEYNKRRLFIGETVEHFKLKEYVVFDFIFNASTNDIDVLYVRKEDNAFCSDIQFSRNHKDFLGVKEVDNGLTVNRFKCNQDSPVCEKKIMAFESLVFASGNCVDYNEFVNKCSDVNEKANDIMKHSRKIEKDAYLYRV